MNGRTIAAAFDLAQAEKRAAFIPYITAGDPDIETSLTLMRSLARAGADILELGVPFSDPIADGPDNQAAATRALGAGTTLARVLDLVARAAGEIDIPVVLFTYYNPIHAAGVERFAEQAAASGVAGVLILDLPPEQARLETLPTFDAAGIDSIFLVAPTSPKRRVDLVAEVARGFVYYVSRTGVTGDGREMSSSLKKDVRRVRRRVGMPVAVGFGVATPDQARAVGRFADGVVVGSALVRTIAEHGRSDDLPERIEQQAAALAQALRR